MGSPSSLPADTVVRVEPVTSRRRPYFLRLDRDAEIRDNGYVVLHGHKVRKSRPGELHGWTSEYLPMTSITVCPPVGA